MFTYWDSDYNVACYKKWGNNAAYVVVILTYFLHNKYVTVDERQAILFSISDDNLPCIYLKCPKPGIDWPNHFNKCVYPKVSFHTIQEHFEDIIPL